MPLPARHETAITEDHRTDTGLSTAVRTALIDHEPARARARGVMGRGVVWPTERFLQDDGTWYEPPTPVVVEREPRKTKAPKPTGAQIDAILAALHMEAWTTC